MNLPQQSELALVTHCMILDMNCIMFTAHTLVGCQWSSSQSCVDAAVTSLSRRCHRKQSVTTLHSFVMQLLKALLLCSTCVQAVSPLGHRMLFKYSSAHPRKRTGASVLLRPVRVDQHESIQTRSGWETKRKQLTAITGARDLFAVFMDTDLTRHLTLALGSSYYSIVNVGGQPFNIALDTGSADLVNLANLSIMLNAHQRAI